jgi:hypothetical protein
MEDGDVVVLVLAVQQQQVAEGLRRVRRVGEEIRKLLEGRCRVVLAEDDRLRSAKKELERERVDGLSDM